jgi:hypothetical protein
MFSVCTTYLVCFLYSLTLFLLSVQPIIAEQNPCIFIKADNYSGFYKFFIICSCQYQLDALSTCHVKYGKCLRVEISPLQQIELLLEGGCSDIMILKKISQG